jgi:hypothetical protein
VAAIAVLVASTGASEATHLGYKRCGDTTTRTVRAAHVQSNFGCRPAHTALRTLLRHGTGGLPGPTTRVGRWGCRGTGFKHFYICERRYSTPGKNPASIVFQSRSRR